MNECEGWLKEMRNGKFIVQFMGKNSVAIKYQMEYDARDSHCQVTYDPPPPRHSNPTPDSLYECCRYILHS